MNPKATKLLYLCTILLIVSSFSCISWAETIEETYASTVKKLRKEGFKGIDMALKSFEGMIEQNQDFIPAYLGAADAVQSLRKNTLQPGQDQLGVILMADYPEVDPGIVFLPPEVGVAGVVNRKMHE